jgi:thiol-disulfide isomerase/thioredoxin
MKHRDDDSRNDACESRRRRNLSALAAVVMPSAVAMMMAGTALVAAQEANMLKGFKATSDSVLEVDGQLDEGAEIYIQRQLPGYLVLPSNATSPVLLLPRTQAVKAVHMLKITRSGAETLDLAPDAIYADRGAFQIEGEGIVFQADGHKYVLREKPALLDLRQASEMFQYSAQYGQLADAYEGSKAALDTLRKESRQVSVRVYFGSWCGFCQQYVPRMLRVGKELEGSNIAIDYYGLPQDFSDPITKRLKIDGVPTAIVYLEGKEVGRMRSDDWRAPEVSLVRLIGG